MIIIIIIRNRLRNKLKTLEEKPKLKVILTDVCNGSTHESLTLQCDVILDKGQQCQEIISAVLIQTKINHLKWSISKNDVKNKKLLNYLPTHVEKYEADHIWTG